MNSSASFSLTRSLAALGTILTFAVLPMVAAFADALPDTIRRVKPGIVGIGTVQKTRHPPIRLLATGFVVADGQHVITNAHAIPDILDTEGREFLAVLVHEGKGAGRAATVVKRDRAHDLALLRFSGSPLSTLRLADSGTVHEGELYAFTGFPIGMMLGMRPVTHRGIICSITPIAIPQMSTQQLDPNMIRRLRNPYDVYQLDATAYPGNSGSPRYDPTSGRVVGVINTVFVKETREAALEKPSGITYAIPSRYVQALLKNAGL